MAGSFKMKGSPFLKPTSVKNKVKAAVRVGATRFNELLDGNYKSISTMKTERYSNKELYKDYKSQLTKTGKASNKGLTRKK